MTSPLPHYLLLSEATEQDGNSIWRFALQGTSTDHAHSACDVEPFGDVERSELLAVVRGLESLDEAARVTLVTRSKYVQQGLTRGLMEWRENGWLWESFGRLVPIRDIDLWKRVDQALKFHTIDCRVWRFDNPETENEYAGAPVRAPHYLRRRRTIAPLEAVSA